MVEPYEDVLGTVCDASRSHDAKGLPAESIGRGRSCLGGCSGVGSSHNPCVAQEIQGNEVSSFAARPIRGQKMGAEVVRPASRVLRGASIAARSCICALASLVLAVNLILCPRVAYADGWTPIPDVQVTAALLEAAFGWVGGALTGVSAVGLGAVGGAVALGGYSMWASENPEVASEFESDLANSFVSQGVGSANPTYAIDLSVFSSNVKDSIIDYVAANVNMVSTFPELPQNASDRILVGMHSSWNGQALEWKDNDFKNRFNNAYTGHYIILYTGNPSGSNPILKSNSAYIFPTDVELVIDGNGIYLDPAKYVGSYRSINQYGIYDYQLTASDSRKLVGSVAYNSTTSRVNCCAGVTFGLGYQSMPTMSGVGAGLSSAFGALVAGTGTASDVVTAGGVTGVYTPNIAIDAATGVASIDSNFDASALTYSDVAITSGVSGGGSGTVDPPATDVLTALQQIITLLGGGNIYGTLQLIPPYLADIQTGIDAIVDTWPTISDIFDGLDTLPPLVGDIADGMGVIIDIPQQLEDIFGVVDGIPTTLDGILDGVTIDIPLQLQQILQGVTSVPTSLSNALSNILSATQAIPANIASALDLDWALDGFSDLKLRLPQTVPLFVIPTATWPELVQVAEDMLDLTPIGPIWDFAGDVLDTIKGDGSSSAPRYVFSMPWLDGRTYNFVVDFADLGPALPVISHAFCYVAFAFWYVKFFRRVREWYRSMLGDASLVDVGE